MQTDGPDRPPSNVRLGLAVGCVNTFHRGYQNGLCSRLCRVSTVGRSWIIGLAILLALFGVGCGAIDGEQGSTGGSLHGSTECGPFEGKHSTTKILISSDNLTCQQAEAFMILLPDHPGHFRIATEGPGEEEASCRVFPPSAHPVSVRCRLGPSVIELVDNVGAKGR
jgi:hypothetical protein